MQSFFLKFGFLNCISFIYTRPSLGPVLAPRLGNCFRRIQKAHSGMSPQPTWSAPRGQPLFSGVTLLKESMRFYTDMFASLPFLTFYFEIISSLQKNCESPKDRFLPTHWRVTRPDPCTLTIHKAIHDGVTCESKERAKRRGTARVRPQAPRAGRASLSASPSPRV